MQPPPSVKTNKTTENILPTVAQVPRVGGTKWVISWGLQTGHRHSGRGSLNPDSCLLQRMRSCLRMLQFVNSAGESDHQLASVHSHSHSHCYLFRNDVIRMLYQWWC